MADKAFIANQTRQAETGTLTVAGSATVGGKVWLEINDKIVAYTLVTGDTTTTAASGLSQAISASTEPEFQQLTNSAAGTVVTVAAQNPARFLTPTGAGSLTVGSSGGPTLAYANVQIGKTPQNGNDVVNYQGGVLPVDGDSLIFDNGTSPMCFDLTYLAAFDIPLIQVLPTFSGNGVGLPIFAAEGYREYRGGRLTVASCDNLSIELPAAATATSYRFDTGSTSPCAVFVAGTGASGIGQEPVDWVGVDGDNSVEVLGAGITIAPNFGDVAVLGAVKAVQSSVSLGSGVTVGSVSLEDSECDSRCNIPALTMNGESSLVIREAATLGTVEIDGGTLRHASSGDITTVRIGSGGTLDLGGSRDPITITNIDVNEGGTLLDPYRRVTYTNGVGLPRTGGQLAGNVTIDLGTNVRLSVAAY